MLGVEELVVSLLGVPALVAPDGDGEFAGGAHELQVTAVLEEADVTEVLWMRLAGNTAAVCWEPLPNMPLLDPASVERCCNPKARWGVSGTERLRKGVPLGDIGTDAPLSDSGVSSI